MHPAELVNSALRPLGVKLRRITKAWKVGDPARDVKTLIDVGCAFGTPEFYATNTKADLFLIDPLTEYRTHIDGILERRKGGFETVALGAEPGEVIFNVEPDMLLRSSASDRTGMFQAKGTVEQRKIAVTTLDDVVERHALRPPFGLKVDTEGHELEVLRGATKTLESTRFVVAEAGVQSRFEGGYDLREFLDAMHELGFAPASILTADQYRTNPIYWVDILFLPST